MGYESKVFIVERSEYKNKKTGKSLVNALVIASYDLCKVGYSNREFFNAFKTPIDYTLWIPTVDKDGNEVMGAVNEDIYGEHMKSADLQELIDALKIAESRERYRRFLPLIAMLQAFVDEHEAWDGEHYTLQAVHYGY